MKLIIAFNLPPYRLPVPVPGAHAGTPSHHPGPHGRRAGRGAARLPLGVEAHGHASALPGELGAFWEEPLAQAGDVLVFRHPTAPGTAHLIQCMRSLGKSVVVIEAATRPQRRERCNSHAPR